MRISSLFVASSLVLGSLTVANAGGFGVPGVYPNYGYGPYGYTQSGYAPTVSCQYPDGWNAGDASRSFRGVPNGINHRCRVNAYGTPIDRDGDPTE